MAAGLRCGSTTIKYLLFFFNFLFVLCGLVILVVGALAANAMRIDGTALNSAVIFIIVLGAFIFTVSFFGCCGAVRESHCMLVTFACLLLAIIVLEVAAAIWLFVAAKGGNIEELVQQVFDSAKKGDKAAMETVDSLQSTLSCCGPKDSAFWGSNIPSSCCKDSPTTCTSPYSKGCTPLFKDAVNKFGVALGVVAICVALVEVIGVWFSLALAGEIKRLSR